MKRTPMKRTAFKSKPRTPMKTKRKALTPIRKSAKGEECTMQLEGVCSHDSETVVWAHSNRASDGKGMGLKANDENGAYACYSCHAVYDRQIKRPSWLTLEDVENAFTLAMKKSRVILERKNLLIRENT